MMGEFNVKFKDQETLHLIKNPSFKSFSILLSLISLASGASLYSSDSFLFKLVYYTGAILIGVSLLDDWEECVFQHSTGKFLLKKTSFWQYLNINHYLPFVPEKNNEVTFPMKGIMGVVSNNKFQMSCNGKYYRIELLMSSGVRLPISELWKTSDKMYCESLCEIIKKFLQLDHIKQLNEDYFEFESSSYDSASSVFDSESSDSSAEETLEIPSTLNRDRLMTLSI